MPDSKASSAETSRLDMRDLLQQTLGDAYVIERELGGGGMSRVFVAVERALNRPVVVKVLASELAATVSVERFAREIRLAAQLQQANIVPLLSAGEIPSDRPGTRGLPYYTMPLVEGASLRHLLAESGPLTEGAAVHVMRDIARALAYAHAHGIVHRDIKPENVLLSGQTAVVTDFGIAKALVEAQTLSHSTTLTAAGSIVGTPQYMAPEQLLGEAHVDHRADLYAFGCVGYELLTGRAPFQDVPPHRLLAAHLSETPAPVTSLRSQLSPALASLIMRCLAKDPAQRPGNAGEILEALDQVVTPRAAGATTSSASGASPRIGRRLGIAIGFLLVAGAVGGFIAWRRTSRAPGPVQLAVLPFINVGGDSAQEYFADGMSVALTTALGRIPGLQLTARSLAFTYKGKPIDVRRVGTELGVSEVIEGTVQRVGSRLRVSAQLTNAKDGVARWTNTYERRVEDLFAVQDSITEAIVAELRGRLTGAATGTLHSADARGTASLDAYDLYLRGVYLLDRRGPGVAQAVDQFNAAIALDSAFAPAYGHLSEALELLPYFAATPAASIEKRATLAARRALALDSTIAEAHVGLALSYGHAYRWQDAESEYRLAMADDSSSAVVRLQYGRHLMGLGQFAGAIAQLRAATRLDPLSATAFVWLAHIYSLIGQPDSAVAIARRARAVDPTLLLGRTVNSLDLAWAGKSDEARTLLGDLDAPAPWMGQASITLATLGDSAGARKILRDLQQLPRNTWLIHTALGFASLATADTARALDELEAAVRAREITPKWFSLFDGVYDPVRASPRFAAVARSFGLDDKLVTAPRSNRPVSPP